MKKTIVFLLTLISFSCSDYETFEPLCGSCPNNLTLIIHPMSSEQYIISVQNEKTEDLLDSETEGFYNLEDINFSVPSELDLSGIYKGYSSIMDAAFKLGGTIYATKLDEQLISINDKKGLVLNIDSYQTSKTFSRTYYLQFKDEVKDTIYTENATSDSGSLILTKFDFNGVEVYNNSDQSKVGTPTIVIVK